MKVRGLLSRILMLIKKSRHGFFRECLENLLSWKFSELSNLFCKTVLKTDYIANVSCVTRILKIAMRASVVKPFFSKVVACKISAFYNSLKNSIRCIGMVWKVVYIVYIVYRDATKNEILTKFLKSILEILENFQEVLCNEVPFLQKQGLTGSLENGCSGQLFEKLSRVPKRTPAWMFYWEISKNFQSSYFFQNTKGQVLPKIQTTFYLEH